MSSESSAPSLLDRLVESFIERQRRGERPSLEEYVQQHPDLANEIREVFPALELMGKDANAAPHAGSSAC